MKHDPHHSSVALPAQPIDRIVRPFMKFLEMEVASGVVLLLCTVVALVLANSPWAQAVDHFWHTPIAIVIGQAKLELSLHHWINDGLMAIFFFVVGLEVKRELMLGELRDPRAAALPIAAAIGGMVVPALIYLTIQPTGIGQRGWGIPMATDIAFVVGCMALLGPRLPHGLRIMLLTLAIADDIGAILVIAIGYAGPLNWFALGAGFLGILVVLVLARLGVRNILMYLVAGAGIWYAFHESGVHATISGVILGLLTPVRALVSEGLLVQVTRHIQNIMEGKIQANEEQRRRVLRVLGRAARETMSPLERLEMMLHPWVGFVIMPLFALANAGVVVHPSGFTEPIALAVVAGLFLGKPIGIAVASWMAVRLGIAKLPNGLNWAMVIGGGALSGIGFTMSLFVASLAYSGDVLDTAKVGVLAGSALSACLGMGMLAWLTRPSAQDSHAPTEG
jgi:NhaA family Na+:H+ antiporter